MSRYRDTLTWVELHRRRINLTAGYLILVVGIAFALLVSQRNSDETRDLAESNQREVELRADEQCVSAWAAREDIRDMAEGSYRRIAQTLIDVFDEPESDLYRRLIERDVAEIRAFLPDPECDLEAARRRLDEQQKE